MSLDDHIEYMLRDAKTVFPTFVTAEVSLEPDFSMRTELKDAQGNYVGHIVAHPKPEVSNA